MVSFSKKEICALLVPLIAEQILAYMVGLADSVMVASAGEAAVSAVSLVDSISVLMINIFAALAAGGSVVVGQYLGRKEFNKAKASGNQLIVILIEASVCITAVLLLAQKTILHVFFGKTEEIVLRNCEIYYRILMCSVPFLALYNGGAALFRIIGDSKTPMIISVIMNICNIVGNAILIYGFRMGVAGVAIPSLFSRILAMLLIFWMEKKRNCPLSLHGIVHHRPDRMMIRNILSIGIPNSLENGMFQFGKLLLVSLVSTLSTAAITANAIGNTVGNLHCVFGMACNIGLTTVVSRCVGAGDYHQARQYTKLFLKIVYLGQGLVNALLMIAIPVINRMYGITGETASLATSIMLIHGFSTMLLWPLTFMLNNAMRAAGDSAFAMVISSVAMWIGRVALTYVLILGFGFGVLSVWIAWDVDWAIRLVFFIPRYVGKKWETKAIRS